MIEESDLLRLVEGDCSPAEAAAIQAWIAADPARGELLDELRAVWRLTGDLTRPWDVGAARGRLLSARCAAPPPGTRRLQLHSRATAPPPPPPPPPPAPQPRRWGTATVWPAGVAAAAVPVVAGAPLWSHRSPPAPPHEHATTPGHPAPLTCPDGSPASVSVGA